MLVMLGDGCLLSPQQVCQSCLLATRDGLPRWYRGKLGCGCSPSLSPSFPAVRCAMGFEVANIAEPISEMVE